MAGRLALVGSGEYLPVLSEVEDWLFADNPRVYVQLATAAAPVSRTQAEQPFRAVSIARQRKRESSTRFV